MARAGGFTRRNGENTFRGKENVCCGPIFTRPAAHFCGHRHSIGFASEMRPLTETHIGIYYQVRATGLNPLGSGPTAGN
jgi:hypothetical protein